MAVISLICSIVGFCCWLLAIVGIVIGVVSMNQLKTSGEKGEGLAKAGIVIGIIALVIGVILYIVNLASGHNGVYYWRS